MLRIAGTFWRSRPPCGRNSCKVPNSFGLLLLIKFEVPTVYIYQIQNITFRLTDPYNQNCTAEVTAVMKARRLQ